VSGQRVGSIGASAIDQRTACQLDGVTLDRAVAETASGKGVRRPELEVLVGFLRNGDTVFRHSLARLARNLDDLRSNVGTLTVKRLQVHLVKEQLTFTGDDAAMTTLPLSVIGAFAEFGRSLIRERQREGTELAKELAKKRVAYRGRRRSLTNDQEAELRRRAGDGVPKATLAREPQDALPVPPRHLARRQAPHHSEHARTRRGGVLIGLLCENLYWAGYMGHPHQHISTGPRRPRRGFGLWDSAVEQDYTQGS